MKVLNFSITYGCLPKEEADVRGSLQRDISLFTAQEIENEFFWFLPKSVPKDNHPRSLPTNVEWNTVKQFVMW